MSDREMLELAAKAAGMHIDDWNCDMAVMYFWDGDPRNPERNYYHWSPITDDGDALRLAVKVGLVVDFRCPREIDNIIGTGVWIPGHEEGPPEFWIAHWDDAGNASRQAIVRAAAEIGRRMQHEH